jgi:uncharacterized protein
MALTPSEVFLRLVDGVADRRYDELPQLYAEQTDVRHPMAPGGLPPLLSRDDLREHFGRGATAAATVAFRPGNVTVHETADPEVIVAEFEYQGHVIDGGEPFAIACVFVLRVRDGEIVESRDYIDHVAFAKVRGQLPAVLARLGVDAAAT